MRSNALPIFMICRRLSADPEYETGGRTDYPARCRTWHPGQKSAFLCAYSVAQNLNPIRQYAVGRAVPVDKSLDIDDDLITHIDAAFHGGRAHMRQQDDLAFFRKGQQA